MHDRVRVVPVSDGPADRIEGFLRSTFRKAGRQYAESRTEFSTGQRVSRLPTDEHGRAKLVCRRYVDKRAVMLSDEGVPACFDPESVDCQGCLEDVREGVVETW